MYCNLCFDLYSFETGNGIKREETSYDKVLPRAKSDASSDDENDESYEIHVQQGSYSYTAPDGTVINVRYVYFINKKY